MKVIRCAIAGVVGRGQIYVDPMMFSENAEITAICDINEEGMKPYIEKIGNGVRVFTDYEEMIDSGLVDLVVIATPIPFHAKQTIYALERNIHVVCEVVMASNVDECREVYKAAKKSKAKYMMAENCNFYKDVMVTDGIIKSGLLGEVHYAEGQYLHYLGVPKHEEWRASELFGASYCSHNLGPMLQWFDNERIVKICCIGSGRHNLDTEGNPIRSEKANVMLCKTESGRLLQVRIDFATKTPYLLPFEVSGAEGRILLRTHSPVETNQIYIDRYDYDSTSYAEEWKCLQYYEKEYLPDSWLKVTENIPNTGHSRADYVMVLEFLKAVAEDREMPVNLDMALNMSLPGMLSKISVENGGEWIDVPDFSKE